MRTTQFRSFPYEPVFRECATQTAYVVPSDAFFHSLAMIVRFFNVLPDFIQMSRDQLWPFVSESLECGTQTMTQWSATVYVSEHAEGLAPDPVVNLEHVQYRVGEEGPLSNDPLFHWVAEAFRGCNIQPLSQWTSLKQALHKIFEDASADLDRVAYLILSATKYSVLLRSPAGWLHFDSRTYSPLCLDASAACVVTSVQELLDHMCNDRDDFKPYNGDDVALVCRPFRELCLLLFFSSGRDSEPIDQASPHGGVFLI